MIVKKRTLLILIILLNSSFCSQDSFASSNPSLSPRLTREEINTLLEKNEELIGKLNKINVPHEKIDYSLKKILIQTCAQLGIMVPWAAIGVFGGKFAARYTFDAITNYTQKREKKTKVSSFLAKNKHDLAVMAGITTSLLLLKGGFEATSYMFSIDSWLCDLSILTISAYPFALMHYYFLEKHTKLPFSSNRSSSSSNYSRQAPPPRFNSNSYRRPLFSFPFPDAQHYQTLELHNGASLEEVKKAYHKLAFQWHPDKNLNNKAEAEIKFKEIGLAYEALSQKLNPT